MCGILGIISDDFTQKSLPSFLEGLKAMKRRGPDDFDAVSYRSPLGHIRLGHARLSIIELSKLGRQPMASFDGRLTVVFNGEIYNYRELKQQLINVGYYFRGNSDTEVLLNCWHLWGPKALDKLDGMFSFSIYDRSNDELYCVRDPFGIKPLFYQFDSHQFIFGSEINAIRKISNEPLRINFEQAAKYINRSIYDNSEDTFYLNIKQVLPGHILAVRRNQHTRLLECSSERWFEIDIRERGNISLSEAKEELRFEFLQSVKRQLRSDVPLGFALSGGVDSSSIVCAAHFLEPAIEINSFSYIASSASESEEQWIDTVVKKKSIKNTKIRFNLENFETDVLDFIIAQGEPSHGLSYFAEFCVYRAAKQNGIKVMLDGHGADEVIAGYNGYPGQIIQSHIENNNWHSAFYFLSQWSRWPGRKNTQALQPFLQGLNGAYKIRQRGNPFIRNKFNLLIDKSYTQISHNIEKKLTGPIQPIKGRALSMKLFDDLTRSSCPPQLRGADRSAMWHSVENRVPFLSPGILKCTLSLPESFLVSPQGESKHIFRGAMRGIVPDEILDRRDKLGYVAETSLQINLTKKIRTLLQEGLERLKFLDSDKTLKFLISPDETISPYGLPWRIFNLLAWASLKDVHY